MSPIELVTVLAVATVVGFVILKAVSHFSKPKPKSGGGAGGGGSPKKKQKH